MFERILFLFTAQLIWSFVEETETKEQYDTIVSHVRFLLSMWIEKKMEEWGFCEGTNYNWQRWFRRQKQLEVLPLMAIENLY